MNIFLLIYLVIMAGSISRITMYFTDHFHQNTQVKWMTYLLIFLFSINCAVGRDFPPLFNAALNRPIITSPTDSTCGVNIRNAYCKSSTINASIERCIQDFCIHLCPGRTTTPGYIDLLIADSSGFGSCIVTDNINIRPNSPSGAASTSILDTVQNCFLVPKLSPALGEKFTLSVWFWLDKPDSGTILQKVSSTNNPILEIKVGQEGIAFIYLSSISTQQLSVSVQENLALQTWHHLAIQVYQTAISFFINGPRVGLSDVQKATLGSVIKDSTGTYRLGQNSEGLSPFKGRLQDFHLYSELLTNREIAQLYSGVFPEVRIQSHCRCPPTHPRVKPGQTHYCIPNGVPDNAGVEILRVNQEAHPLEYANDGDSNTIWISRFQSQVDLIVDLGDEFQVFYVVIQFYSPLPKAVTVERQRNNSDVWEVWQYYAENCTSYFNKDNNGPLPTSTSINCLQFGTNNLLIPLSRGNITFNILPQEPVPRPGYNDFYNTPELYNFVKASKIRVRFQDHFFVTNLRHEYYGVYEYAVSARCNCHGHAETCDMSTLPYKCNCLQPSNTQGNQCETCQPLYNNKPFRLGDQTNDYNCQLCQCYNHATSCYYNVTLDQFPGQHDRGGGGVCVACQDNTEGQMCDSCIDSYFRPIGKSLYDKDVCQSCNCNETGIAEVNSTCEKVGGQCACKELVSGRQCDICKDGYYNLQPVNPVGCETCDCSINGTVNFNVSCDINTGQCYCKRNVRNRQCDACEYGYYNLTTSNPDGCTPCDCDPQGSQSIYCNPESGQCQCKENIVGLKCNECSPNFFNFSLGCVPCNCNTAGIEAGTICEPVSGQCVCKQQVDKRQCDTCKDGAYGFGSSPATGCEVCTCNKAGVDSNADSCDVDTGSCVCKERVFGRMCNRCKGNTWGLNVTNPLGCDLCECDPTGTQQGDSLPPDSLACNNGNGQCSCLANRFGRQCEICNSGYYNDDKPGGGCNPCACHPKGTLEGTQCNVTTGQCECQTGRGVGGRACSVCAEKYYGFDANTGSCNPCNCLASGSVNDTCQPISGQCMCKEFVTGRQCDVCIPGASNLDPDNPYGCSKSPSQQPPPTHLAQSPEDISLYWGPPDHPNGVISQYNVIRDGVQIGSTSANVTMFNDTGLLPYTSYTYQIEAVNAFGSVRSTAVTFRTKEGYPIADVILQVYDIRAKSASFRWNQPSVLNGPLLKYALVSRTPSLPDNDTVHWEGTVREVTLTNLIPFTRYNMSVLACTLGGCTRNEAILVATPSAVPEEVGSPNISAISNTELFIDWEHPAKPNGIIIFYELWMQGAVGTNGVRNPVSARIFSSSGQYNPRPVETPKENALQPPATNFTVKGLDPFTEYEFQVLAENDAGKGASPWTIGRTGEAKPGFMNPPVVTGVTSYRLNVSWTAPSDKEARGVIVTYHVYQFVKTDLTVNQFAPPYQWILVQTVPGTQFSILVLGLTPYSEHNFMIGACNSIDCVNSTSASGRLLPAAPEGVVKPSVDGFNSTVMLINWTEPLFPNGPSPNYVVEKTEIALSYPPQVDKGTRFPGGGYYIFPPTAIPQNVAFTGIRFAFRMSSQSGLLFFSASTSQEEFIALQFDDGRPKFLFDTQGCLQVITLNGTLGNLTTTSDGEWHYVIFQRTGSDGQLTIDGFTKGCSSIAYITTTNDEGLRYAQGDWHVLEVRRSGIYGSMVIDNKWKGSSSIKDTACRTTSIIGPTTGVYIGGLPPDFVIKRNDQRASISRTGFQGCIRDIEILQQESPVEVWKKLEWTDAVANELAFLNWEGCPVNLDKGIHFLGQGYAKLPYDARSLIGGDDVEVSFQFRTALHTGMLFFTYGGTGIYMYAGVINGTLYFEFSNGLLKGSATYNNPDSDFCDGNWRSVFLRKKGLQANLTVEGVGTVLNGDPDTVFTVPTASEIFVGGIPKKSEVLQFMENSAPKLPREGFGGCIAFFAVDGSRYDFGKDATQVVNVNMDGCAPFQVPNNTCQDRLITEVYNGYDTQTFDTGLQPYTDYIYRVTASNSVGSGSGPWAYGRTKEGAPTGVKDPFNVQALSGYTIQAEWNKPASTSGLLSKFILVGYVHENDTIAPIQTEFLDTDSRAGNLTNAVPYTSYIIKLSACTAGGCTESEDGVPVMTLSEAPEEVPSPTAIPSTTSLAISWSEPGKPNGPLSGYYLYQDNVQIYQGGERFYQLNNLQVYTSYQFFIRACTSSGCTSGPIVTLTTSQLPPTSVNPPVLKVLGTKKIEARWETPAQVNGALERYVLHMSTDGSVGEAVYNNTELFLFTTLTNLTAGTQYFLRLSACTGGGCTMSDVVNATTAESAPEGLPDPVVTSPSWAELEVTWGEPELPNGVIVRYELYHNSIMVTSGLTREYRVANLQPYSLHIIQVAACTSIGCGYSNEVKTRTQEAPPEGIVTLEVVGLDPRSVNATWTAPDKPNGHLYFDVYFDGLFYRDTANRDYRTDELRKSLLRTNDSYKWTVIDNLIPYTIYKIQVNASNTKGFILSNIVSRNMPAGTPDGVSPPSLRSETPNSIKAQWPPVGRVNSNEEASYLLQFREKSANSIVQDIFGPTSTLVYTKENLLAHTEYEFRVVASNSHGPSFSDWATQITKQDRPLGVMPPQITSINTRYIDLVWTAPLSTNGIIKDYRIYQNTELRLTLAGNVTSQRIDNLVPYTYYIFKVEACTLGGCTKSEESSRVRTLQAAPDVTVAPNATSLTPTSVELKWLEPTHPNGVINTYTIERRLTGTEAVVFVGTVPATQKAYIDQSADLSPYTSYDYRLKVVNSAGEGISPWTAVVTRPSRPSGVTVPLVEVRNATSIHVKWVPPIRSNGQLEYYIIRLPEPRVEIRNTSVLETTISNLTPYTRYSVTLTACTSGGCSESSAVVITTMAAIPDGQAPPTPTAVSQSLISVVWQPPSNPNGVVIGYELSRQKMYQPLNPSATDLGVWVSAYKGSALFYEDRGLPMFTTFVYRVTVFNNIGQKTSEPSENVTSFGGLPRQAPDVTVTPTSHQSLLVTWVTPGPVVLQGKVEKFTIETRSNSVLLTNTTGAETTSLILENLTPDTEYSVVVGVTIYGGGSLKSDPVTARTLNGAPQGIAPPALTVISETALRVSWSAPSQPNGDIINYNIYIDDRIISTNMSTPSSIIVNDLQPFTVYQIKVEVCTVFQCSQSPATAGTTSESLPQGLANPVLQALNSTAVQVTWSKPNRENGIIRSYNLWRKTLKKCVDVTQPAVNPEQEKCTYVECGILQSRCGQTCYTGTKRCCNGVLHDAIFGYECCDTKYVPKPSTDAVCCGGAFYSPLPNYQCCGARYVMVPVGSSCCADTVEDRITIGYGDSCCGSVPYSSTGSQICCTNQLFGRYSKQCCGGLVVSDSAVCCGNGTTGEVYLPQQQRSCCGEKYVDTQSTLCCTSDTGHEKAHYYTSITAKQSANEKCCGTEKITNGLSCCNYVGYNPASQVCADKSSNSQETGCGTGTVCSISEANGAFCNRCNFNSATSSCGAVPGYHVKTPTPGTPTQDMCTVDVQMIYSDLLLTYTDTVLSPFTQYEYSVTVTNNAGSLSTDYVGIQTLSAPPDEVRPPNVRVNPEQLYAVYLSWEMPGKPNGVIIRYVLKRDGIELYRGMNMKYTDDNSILPYQSYTYQLTVCNIAGCTDSKQITVATAQAAPEGVSAPTSEALSSTSVRLTWLPPSKPNGLIISYTIMINDTEYTNLTLTRQLTVTGLVPYKEYQVYLEVCTVAGCTKSPNVTAKTSEALPQGILPPRLITIDMTTVELFWGEPTNPNGLIIKYNIIRKTLGTEDVIYRGTELTTRDLALTPEQTYEYAVEAVNSAGTTRSAFEPVTLPKRTPAFVPVPKNVTVLSATEIYVLWDPVAVSGVVDQYRILLTSDVGFEFDRSFGLMTSTTISSLLPYTEYGVRLKVCLMGVPNGCGVGEVVKVRTFEAPPFDMAPPTLEAKAADTILISWKLPAKPNGIITMYRIYKRLFGETIEILINQRPASSLSFIHAGSDLLPYTQYEYRVVALNSKGEATSAWAVTRTLEAIPELFDNPVINSTGAHGFVISWSPPKKPNGVITLYNLYYKEVSPDPAVQRLEVKIEVNATSTSVSGLKPFTNYDVRVEAVNGAGLVSSGFVRIETAQSSPAGLLDFNIEKINTGQAVILRWNPPLKPNGVIETYKVYEEGITNPVYQGLSREFEFRRLEPYTQYTVRLEVCTTAGCTKGKNQIFKTAEVAPSVQPAPTMALVNSTHVLLKWTPPVNPNGEITSYEVLRRENRNRRKRAVTEPTLVFKTLDTKGTEFEFMDSGLKPHTNYEYQIRAVNSQGSTESPWLAVSTNQAPPEGVLPPRVSHVDGKVDVLLVEWDVPSQTNGVMQSYQIKRNTSVPFSFPADEQRRFQDSGLQAFTWYEYSLTACSGGGCTSSSPTLIRTKESAPLQVTPPSVSPVNSTAIKATWIKPQITNGQITLYMLMMDGNKIYEGLDMEYTMSGLVPYQEYKFTLQACTSGGCASSGEVSGRPDDARPESMLAPILSVMSSTSIEVSWQPPSKPNGVISSYDVRRGDQLIYTESLSTTGFLKTRHTDYSLQPGEEYTYIVVARNRKGSVSSPPSKARTYASSPNGLEPPSLEALSSSSVRAIWKAPVRPNGALVNYTLFKENDVVYSGDPNQLSYIVPGLAFWTVHSFRIQACTLRGCELSSSASVRTLEARPEEQNKPSLLAMADANGAHTGVMITWDPPLRPNGAITKYDVNRRLVVRDTTGMSYGEPVLVYNGTQLRYTDNTSELLPFTEYQYQIIAYNQMGRAISDWQLVKTKEAPPSSVLPPNVIGSTAFTIDVEVTPPSQPNGVIRMYNILANDTLYSSSPALRHTVGTTRQLLPFTSYALKVRACTSGGCTDSSSIMAKTGSAKPNGLAEVSAAVINSTSVQLTWQEPQQPNGEILRYMLYQRTACPKTSQVFNQNCSIGDSKKVYEGKSFTMTVASLQPYTAYEFQIMAENKAGANDFPTWIRVETQPAAPEYVNMPILAKISTEAQIDWTNSFKLNGKLVEYVLLVDGSIRYQGMNTVGRQERTTRTNKINFIVRAKTESGEVETPTIVFDPEAVGNIGTVATTTPTPEKQTSAVVPFYQEVWFIVILCILGLIILFIIIILCVRCCGSDLPYVRERRPLHSRQPKSPSSLAYIVDPNSGFPFVNETEIPNQQVYQGPGPGVINPAFSNRVALSPFDKESDLSFMKDDDDDDDFLYEKNFDSGLYDDESISGPTYSYTREQTVFTDTHL